ncbi:MAG: Hsp20/alpha crystallin family protein [Syntrophales bacterium]|nr:Hsp20/alpha crystallin family protein [Syntrophales bacterium]MDD5643247.1 Hsp20/alpha crystallin family protein [Syntrophales bacterium]
MHRVFKIRIMRDFDHLEERMRRLMDNVFDFQEAGVSFRPPVDFYETSQGLVLRMELAGVTKEDISLTLHGQELVIQGKRRPVHPEGVSRCLHHEINYGSFDRRFRIPVAIDPDGLQARYLDGILEVFLPRKAPASKRILVREVPES